MGEVGCRSIALSDSVSVGHKGNSFIFEQLGQVFNFHFRTINLIIRTNVVYIYGPQSIFSFSQQQLSPSPHPLKPSNY